MGQAISRIRVRIESWNKLVFIGVGLLLLGWLLNTPAGLLGKADAIGYAVCHRIDLRSFHLGERQLPLCARCTGMYLGAVLGLVYQGLVSRKRAGMPSKGIIVAMAFFILAFAIDGLNSFLSLIPTAPHLYDPQNWLRLLTGMGMGLAIAIAIFPGFNQTMWVDHDPRPAMGNWTKFAGLLGLAALLVVLVLTDNPLLLYPLALVSAGGVLLLLTVVYSMVWVMIMGAENRYQRINQMLLPLVAGFGMALFQIVLLDLGRYWLTGTWEGFHLG
jgi:uncharacterized membrane protein